MPFGHIYDKRYNGKPVIEELISFIRRDFCLSETQFAISSSEGINFSRYLGYVGGHENAKSIVSILTEDSWRNISDRSALKIVDSSIDKYNRVNSSGWEFYTAVKGLDYESPQGFL